MGEALSYLYNALQSPPHAATTDSEDAGIIDMQTCCLGVHLHVRQFKCLLRSSGADVVKGLDLF